MFAVAEPVQATGFVRPGTARQQARQGDRHEAHVGAAGEAAPTQVIGAAQRGGDVAHAFEVGEGVDFQHAGIERQHGRHEGGGGDGRELCQPAHVVGRGPRGDAMADGVVDHHQAVRLAAGHAEFFLVDPAERDALVELQRPLEVAAELAPGDGQQPHLDAPARLDAGDQPGEAAPASFQRPEARMVEHGVELIAQGGVDVGDVAVECRAQPVSSRRQQAGQRLAEPRFQRFAEAQPAVEEGCELAGGVGCACWPKKLASQHRLAQGPTLLRRLRRAGAAIVASSPMVCRSRQ